MMDSTCLVDPDFDNTDGLVSWAIESISRCGTLDTDEPRLTGPIEWVQDKGLIDQEQIAEEQAQRRRDEQKKDQRAQEATIRQMQRYCNYVGAYGFVLYDLWLFHNEGLGRPEREI